MPRSRFISDLHWVRAGQQTRSQRTQASLLEAAAVLFAEKGVETTSVNDVAARAGCSVGAVYHHFRDKKTLRYAVFERMCDELRATTREALDPARWEGASVADRLLGYLEFSLAIGRERPAMKGAGLRIARGEPALREHFAELRSELLEGIAGLLLGRREEIGHPDPELASAFVVEQLSTMLEARLDGKAGPSPLSNRSDEAFLREALRSALGYLEVDVAPAELGAEA